MHHYCNIKVEDVLFESDGLLKHFLSTSPQPSGVRRKLMTARGRLDQHFQGSLAIRV